MEWSFTARNQALGVNRGSGVGNGGTHVHVVTVHVLYMNTVTGAKGAWILSAIDAETEPSPILLSGKR